MEKRTYIKLWVSVKALLFIIPILIGIWWTPYAISKDQMYVDNVVAKAYSTDGYNTDGKITDFTRAERAKHDAEGKYINKVWKLEHKELYWLDNVGAAFLLALMLQVLLGLGRWTWKVSKEMMEEVKDEN